MAKPVEAMLAVLAQPLEVIPALSRQEEGTPQAHRRAVGAGVGAVGTPEVDQGVAGVRLAVTTNLLEG